MFFTNILQTIITEARRGSGTREDPWHTIHRLWLLNGTPLCEYDYYTEKGCISSKWPDTLLSPTPTSAHLTFPPSFDILKAHDSTHVNSANIIHVIVTSVSRETSLVPAKNFVDTLWSVNGWKLCEYNHRTDKGEVFNTWPIELPEITLASSFPPVRPATVRCFAQL